LVIGAWIVVAIALAPLQGALQERAADESDAFKGASAESTRAQDLIDKGFREGNEVNAVLVYVRDSGLTVQDRQRISAEAKSLCASHALPDLEKVITPWELACGDLSESSSPATPATGPISEDGTTALVTVQTTDDATDRVTANIATLRALMPDPDAHGLRGYVTGRAGFEADQSLALEGIDQTLLAITVGLVLVLLLIVYRSPVAAAVPLVVVSLAYLIAAGAVYGLAAAGAITVTGQATAILIVLMFGAGTDYCLLVVSRMREELARTGDAAGSLDVAVRRSGPAILSAGGIVVAAMLLLALADYRATAGMGPVLALGIAVTMLAGRTLLPALLAVLGPRTFWPRAPVAPKPGIWRRAGALVRARPGTVIAVLLALLCAGALGNLEGRGILGFDDAFRHPPESVQAQRLIADRYNPGLVAPTEVVVDGRSSGVVAEALADGPGVGSIAPVSVSADQKLTLLEIVLDRDPFAGPAIDAVPALRDIARRAAGPGRSVLLGGATAESFDTRATLRADAKLIVPLTLLLILLVLTVLVRAVLAPIYLVGTVVLSYAFALGASSLVFTHVLGWPDSDPTQGMFAFIFLVALGVDYNIFLVGRIQEERERRAHADAVVAGLERSGSVITSAGLILAGTFCALLALEVVSLVQVGFTVALGLLVDAFLVRSLLVPALAIAAGERSWRSSWRFAAGRNLLLMNAQKTLDSRQDRS
jgi:RND superfamily putative drug exporter